MTTETRKPRVAVIGTGGSMSTLGRHSLDLFEYGDFGRVMDVDELLTRVPEVAMQADVFAARCRAIRSTRLGPNDWLAINETVHQLVETESPLDGIVITHGTATMEETSYFLNLTLKVDLPVVLVGGFPTTGLSSDTPLNLVNAVRVASSPKVRGLGVLVVFNDEIQPAREVTKGSNYRKEMFRCPDLGMLGYSDPDGRVSIYRAPTRRHAPDTDFDVRGLKELPRVDIAYSYPGADGTVVNALVAVGAKGIVSAGMAPGKGTLEEQEAMVEAVRRGVLVVQSSRSGSARVIRSVRLRNQGFVVADNLSAQKARVLAMLALTVTSDPERIQDFFDEY